MARKAIVIKQQKLAKKYFAAKAEGRSIKHPTKFYNRCQLCGRVKSYVRDFGVCRVCLRKYGRAGMIM
jgi:small subunit ribosomal protein S14